jgi:hypothetical protein
MSNTADILPELLDSAEGVDSYELHRVIRLECLAAIQESAGEILCGPYKVDSSNFALRLKFSKDDALTAVEAGPLCSAELVSGIRARIRTGILNPGPVAVYSKVLFAERKLKGIYRYRDLAQILPMPPGSPQPLAAADYPLRLELKLHISEDPVISQIRFARHARRWELLLCGLLSNRIHQIDTGAHWVLVGPGACVQALAHYEPMGFPQSPEFTDMEAFPRAQTDDPRMLFGPPARAHGEPLSIPSNLPDILDAFWASDARQEQFLRACYWLQQADLARTNAFSPTFLGLVAAAETLFEPHKGTCATCGQEIYKLRSRFEEFLRKYLSPEVLSDASLPGQKPFLERLKQLYDHRSKIAHGAVLSGYDGDYQFAPSQNLEVRDVAVLSQALPAAMGKWMLDHSS